MTTILSIAAIVAAPFAIVGFPRACGVFGTPKPKPRKLVHLIGGGIGYPENDRLP